MKQLYKFDIPLDKPYDPLRAVCLGASLTSATVKWTLDVSTGIIILRNDVGVEIALGRLTKAIKRCSLAFKDHRNPYFILEYMDETKTLFSYDRLTNHLKSHPIDFTDYRCVSIFYNKAICRSGLVVSAIGKDGIYRGTISGDSLAIKNINPLSNTTKLEIQRFGLDTENKLVTELAEVI